MKKIIFSVLIQLILLIGIAPSLLASHITAADISYRCLGGNQYEITLCLYRDCSGTALPPSATINLNSSSCSQNLNLTLSQVSVREVSSNCPAANSTCTGGTVLGFSEATYKNTVSLVACADWVMSYSICCRTGSTTNVNSTGNFYIESMLNNTGGICNNSPKFSGPPILATCNGSLLNISHSAFEADGDSLFFRLATPKTGATTMVSYNATFSTNAPFLAAGPTLFNSSTGQLSFTPNGIQASTYDVVVEEYRAGVLLGSTRLSTQLATANCGNNQSHSLDEVFKMEAGVWVSYGQGRDFEVCPGERVELVFLFSDPDTNQTLSIDSLRTNLLTHHSNATIQSLHPQGNRNQLWVHITIPHVNLGIFRITAQDNNCSYKGLQSWGIRFLTRPVCAIIRGRAVIDNNVVNCIAEPIERGIPGAIILASKGSYTKYATTDASGYYEMQTDTGTYILSTGNVLNNAWQPCLNSVPVMLTTYGTADTISFPFQPLYSNCPVLTTDISTPILRLCMPAIYTVSYSNIGSVTAIGAYIEVEIDTVFFTVDSTSIPIFSQVGTIFTFQLDSIAIFTSGFFRIYTKLKCNLNNMGMTHCTAAHIYPDSLCFIPTIWTRVDIGLSATCYGDSIGFRIENKGAAMSSNLNYRLLANGQQIQTGTFQLGSGASQSLVVQTTGATYRLEAEQAPSHPTSFRPSVTVERCAPAGTTTTTNWVNVFAEDDGALFYSIDCQANVGSYDPNDKRAFPEGYGTEHYMEANQDIEYHIRFQNTGTDTAFMVILHDSISALLNIQSILPGASSHPYTWELMGTNNPVLVFRFDNIMLPDSNVNEAASHGFVKFRIQQQPNNPVGSRIENNVDIFFDFNAPVRTNTAFHTIGENFVVVISAIQNTEQSLAKVRVYPNPFGQSTRLEVLDVNYQVLSLTVFDALGRQVRQVELQGQNAIELHRQDLPQGIYYYQLKGDGLLLDAGKLIAR